MYYLSHQILNVLGDYAWPNRRSTVEGLGGSKPGLETPPYSAPCPPLISLLTRGHIFLRDCNQYGCPVASFHRDQSSSGVWPGRACSLLMHHRSVGVRGQGAGGKRLPRHSTMTCALSEASMGLWCPWPTSYSQSCLPRLALDYMWGNSLASTWQPSGWMDFLRMDV